MRATATITRGPTRRATRRPPGRPNSQRKWTDSRGPVKTISHYDSDDADAPSWISNNASGSQWIDNVVDLAGQLAVTVDQSGDVTYEFTNLHGDIEAVDPAGSSPVVAPDYDEFGNTPASATAQYGWLGGQERSVADLGGLVLMGARLYDPLLGRFLQTDPMYGGSANAYDYCDQDPINQRDLTGWSTVQAGGLLVAEVTSSCTSAPTSLADEGVIRVDPNDFVRAFRWRQIHDSHLGAAETVQYRQQSVSKVEEDKGFYDGLIGTFYFAYAFVHRRITYTQDCNDEAGSCYAGNDFFGAWAPGPGSTNIFTTGYVYPYFP